MLSTIVERHIALHHATGYLFRRQSILLRDYARFAGERGDGLVRAATALEWAGRVRRRERVTDDSKWFVALRG